jgi:hypothetical protein
MRLDPLSLGPKPCWARRTFLFRLFSFKPPCLPIFLSSFLYPLFFEHSPSLPPATTRIKNVTLPSATHATPLPPSPMLLVSMLPTSPQHCHHCRYPFYPHTLARAHSRTFAFAVSFAPPSPSPCHASPSAPSTPPKPTSPSSLPSAQSETPSHP